VVLAGEIRGRLRPAAERMACRRASSQSYVETSTSEQAFDLSGSGPTSKPLSRRRPQRVFFDCIGVTEFPSDLQRPAIAFHEFLKPAPLANMFVASQPVPNAAPTARAMALRAPRDHARRQLWSL